MNEILKRIYRLQPSIGAWAKTGMPNVLWAEAPTAKAGVAAYVGPSADPLVMRSLHIEGDDLAFIRSEAALHAMWAVVDAIYFRKPLPDGLFPEESCAHS